MMEENFGSGEDVNMEVDKNMEKVDFENSIVDKTSTTRSRKRKAKDRQSTRKRKKMERRFRKKFAQRKLKKMNPELKYVVESKEEACGDPQFEVVIHVNGHDFIGRGPSKRKAKLMASRAALFSYDVNETVNVTSERIKFEEKILISSGPMTVKVDPLKVIKEVPKSVPVIFLNDLIPGLSYSFVEEKFVDPTQRFRASVEVNGKIYEGTGQAKKQAKASAAHAVICTLYNECTSLYMNYVKSLITKSDGDSDNDHDVSALSQELAEKMQVLSFI